MLLKQFVCMAAIDQLKFPIFQRKYKKLQIATSTVGLISDWIFEMIDLWPWVEVILTVKLAQLERMGRMVSENGENGERMGLMVSEEPAEELPEEPLSQLVSTGLRSTAGQLHQWILSQISIECCQLTIDQSNDLTTMKKY